MIPFNCIEALRALGEENRLRLLRSLLDGERSVNELAELTGATQYNVSKHLRVLRNAGLVDVSKHGQQRFYGLAEACLARLEDNRNVLDLGCCKFFFDRIPA